MLDNHTFLGLLGNTSAVDKMVMSMHRPGEGYIIKAGTIYHFAHRNAPLTKYSDVSEQKKKTKRGRR
jgi:hypothetical protein